MPRKPQDIDWYNAPVYRNDLDGSVEAIIIAAIANSEDEAKLRIFLNGVDAVAAAAGLRLRSKDFKDLINQRYPKLYVYIPDTSLARR